MQRNCCRLCGVAVIEQAKMIARTGAGGVGIGIEQFVQKHRRCARRFCVKDHIEVINRLDMRIDAARRGAQCGIAGFGHNERFARRDRRDIGFEIRQRRVGVVGVWMDRGIIIAGGRRRPRIHRVTVNRAAVQHRIGRDIGIQRVLKRDCRRRTRQTMVTCREIIDFIGPFDRSDRARMGHRKTGQLHHAIGRRGIGVKQHIKPDAAAGGQVVRRLPGHAGEIGVSADQTEPKIFQVGQIAMDISIFAIGIIDCGVDTN